MAMDSEQLVAFRRKINCRNAGGLIDWERPGYPVEVEGVD